MEFETMNITVAWVSPCGSVKLDEVPIPIESNIFQAIALWGKTHNKTIEIEFIPETAAAEEKYNTTTVRVDGIPLHVAVFGKSRFLLGKIEDAERIELLKPIICNPKEARRKRALKARKS